MTKRIEKIARLNDEFRRTREHQFLMTEGVQALGAHLIKDIIEAVKAYDAFNPENNPQGERDFGDFEIEGHKLYWKIDYYAKPRAGEQPHQRYSDDPADPDKTDRVLTVLLMGEL